MPNLDLLLLRITSFPSLPPTNIPLWDELTDEDKLIALYEQAQANHSLGGQAFLAQLAAEVAAYSEAAKNEPILNSLIDRLSNGDLQSIQPNFENPILMDTIQIEAALQNLKNSDPDALKAISMLSKYFQHDYIYQVATQFNKVSHSDAMYILRNVGRVRGCEQQPITCSITWALAKSAKPPSIKVQLAKALKSLSNRYISSTDEAGKLRCALLGKQPYCYISNKRLKISKKTFESPVSANQKPLALHFLEPDTPTEQPADESSSSILTLPPLPLEGEETPPTFTPPPLP